MTDNALDALRWQFGMTWTLAERFHLPGLTDEMCLWEPGPGAWSVRLQNGAWVTDWSDKEPEVAPPTSIAWVAWHIAWWWTETIARATGKESPGRLGVLYPGSADGVREQLMALAQEWRALIDGLDAAALAAPSTFPWSERRPFAMTVAWVNVELMKNVAEIGAIRHIYEAHHPR